MSATRIETLIAIAKATAGDAAKHRLARGLWVSYRRHDTPRGHVLRRHPDGDDELVRVDPAGDPTGG